MRWGLFILVLLAAYIVQTAVLPLFAPSWFDLLLIVALVYGLTAPPVEARLAGWIIGFAQDVGSLGPLGLHALALGLATYGLTHLREAVNRELWWVRGLAALIVAWPAQLLILLHMRFLQDAALSAFQIMLGSLTTALSGSMIAGLVVGVPGAWRRRRRHALSRW